MRKLYFHNNVNRRIGFHDGPHAMQKHPHNPMQKRCETINGKAGQYKWLTYQEVYNMVLKIGSGLRSCGIEHISERYGIHHS
ncbi:long chain acyl-CoA synthetase 5 isoform X4 [Cryptomeria japonica]|uniref:long chain acyl-CoA synthetase 5 isoform X4 n=1 Tax=Cryptomeria japonica TaxID=3369 RepID=UPI0025ABEECD|nr:long chain acyl-CoA synthetase 5 isoform X4 [Cryptomeria japonica]